MQSFMAGSRLGYGLLAKLANGQRANLDLSKRGADLSRGPQALSKLPAAAWSNTWPAPAATLDLDFANNRGFVRGSGQGGAMDAVTFTRASSGNWVDNTGTLRTGAGTFTGTANALGVNLLTAPQNYENAAWTKGASSVVANSIVAPDNTITGYSLVEDATTASHLVFQAPSVLAAGTYTFIAYVRAAGRNFASIKVANTGTTNQWAAADFDLVNITGITAVGAGGQFSSLSQTITDAGNGWRLCTLTCTSSSTFSNVGIQSSNSATPTHTNFGDISIAGLSAVGLYIWGSQFQVGSSATTYYPTNINAPRFDWASTATNASQVNLLTSTQVFANWTKYQPASVTVTDNSTTAPDGTTTAAKIVATLNNGPRVYQRPVLTPQTYTFSIYVKSAGSSTVTISVDNLGGNQSSMLVNLSDGTFSTSNNNSNVDSASFSTTSVGSGWYRCVITYALNASGAAVNMLQDIIPTYSNGTDGVYVWGGQLQTGSSATAYQAIGAQSPTNTPLVANSTCNGLLIEESRTNRILWCRDGLNGGTAVGTNLLTYSEQFDNAAWNGILNSSVTANQTTAPDSTNTADLIASNATNGSHYMFRANSLTTITSGVRYTFSIYLKKGSGATAPDIMQVAFAAGGVFPTGYANFNISAGTIGTTSSVTASITNIGSGWYRCSITDTATATSTSTAVAGVAFTNNNDGLGRLPSYVDATTSNAFIWGAQLLPLGLLTDYQVTAASAVTNVWSRSNVTVAKTATGIDGVANAATTITATANNAVLIQPISLASGSRTGSVYLKRITGTGNVQVTLDGSTWSTVDLSNGLWNRIVLSGTVTNPCVGVLLATNGDAVAMDYAQVEDGAFVTSPILTTTATATRSADVGNVNVNLFGPNVGGYNKATFYGNFTPLSYSASNVGLSMRDTIGNGNSNNIRMINVGNGNFQFLMTAGAVGSNSTVVSPLGNLKAAASFEGGFVNGAVSGTNGTNTTAFNISGSSQPLINSFVLGGDNVGTVASMWVKRAIFAPVFQDIDQLRNLVGNT